MDFNSLIQLKRERFEQLEHDIADPRFFPIASEPSDHARAREHQTIAGEMGRTRSCAKQLDDNRELARSPDVEIAAMADDEIPELEKRVADLEREVQIALLPSDENEDRDAIVEIRLEQAGAKPPFSLPIFTACIIATRSPPA